MMMYNQKFITCLKSNGKILREFKDTVYIPYQAEYSILLKNLNSVRALAHISIDGKQVSSEGIVVNPNSEFEIERFIKNGNLNKGNRFKFIERTKKIENHRGVKSDDGLIRVSFKYEKILQPVVWPIVMPYHYARPYPYEYPWVRPYPWEYRPTWYSVTTTNGDPAVYGSITGGQVNGSNVGGAQTDMMSSGTVGAAAMNNSGISSNAANINTVFRNTEDQPNDAGITVPGSESNQAFTTVSSFATENEEHVIVLRILGETKQGKGIVAPVTVKTKPKCDTCGKTNKATSKYCSSCGTALEIV